MIPSRLFRRYLVIGGLSYVIEMSALYVLKNGLQLTAVQSVAISFWIGLTAAFLLQKTVAFTDRRAAPGTLMRQVLAYGLLAGWNYIFTLVAVKLLSDHASVFVIRTAAIIIITVWNFLIYKRLFNAGTKS
jgi:putative flippase GtrA